MRRKLANLYRKKVPTGNPNMPEEVRLAKQIKFLIAQKADIGDAEKLSDLQDGYIDGGDNNNNEADFPLGQPEEDRAEEEDK